MLQKYITTESIETAASLQGFMSVLRVFFDSKYIRRWIKTFGSWFPLQRHLDRLEGPLSPTQAGKPK